MKKCFLKVLRKIAEGTQLMLKSSCEKKITADKETGSGFWTGVLILKFLHCVHTQPHTHTQTHITQAHQRRTKAELRVNPGQKLV